MTRSGRKPSAVSAVPLSAHAAAQLPDHLARRVIVEHIEPAITGGRFPIKRTPGEAVDVAATIFADGHDVIAAVLRDRPAAGEVWRESPMTLVAPGTDRWHGCFEPSIVGWHEYAIVAWVDRFLTWRRGLNLKAVDGQDVTLELLEGSLLVREAAERAVVTKAAGAAEWLLAHADVLSDATPMAGRVHKALDEELANVMMTFAGRERATESARLRVWVDRDRARLGAWCEMFPRSFGADPTHSGTMAEAAAHLSYIADLGFDVVYLPPIHPIGRSFRKGPNNALRAGPGAVGSPWAIGSDAGGHTAVDPALGTVDDFLAFRQKAERLGLEVALDLAWQCSPDHPWVREHPEWFRHRPDGTIKYAENPPKRYQDIYPLDFENDDWRTLWLALLEVTRVWIDRGVRIFRVDNPHTKTLRFWEWLIDEVHRRDPGVVFLSEAFTRPALMQYLAKAGFTQSYTYFTWRNTKEELTAYFGELTETAAAEYLRPNLFANTPDILHAYLQNGGRPAFQTRLLLAATLGASYGIYSGYELCENRAVRPGSEEYADSEKYQIVKRDWNRPGHIKELVARLNRVRREHRALQFDRSLRFHATDNPQIIAYTKSAPGPANHPLDGLVMTIVNLDPHHMQHGHVSVPGVEPDAIYNACDALDEATYTWRGGWNYVRFDPEIRQGHVFTFRR